MIAVFQEITCVDGDTARFYLENARWQVELAMSSFCGEEAPQPIVGDLVNLFKVAKGLRDDGAEEVAGGSGLNWRALRGK